LILAHLNGVGRLNGSAEEKPEGTTQKTG